MSATPKRPKTVWTVLLRNVDASLIPDAVDLEKLLSNTEDADIFAHNCEMIQRIVLNSLLGEGRPELVDSIIQSIKQSLRGPVSLMDRIMSYDLAPSKIKEKEVFDVANCIINAQPGCLLSPKKRFVSAVFGVKYEQPDSQPDLTKWHGTLKIRADLINQHEQKTFNVTVEEAAGYTMLGIYAVMFSEILSEELSKVMMYWNQMMTADNKKRGQNPTSDTAIIMLLEESGDTSLNPKMKPVVVYKYKPTVHQDHERVNDCDLMEALLQAYYCLRFYEVSQMIHCLTDLSTWHYFKVNTSADKLNIEWWHRVDHSFPLNVEMLTEHAGFLTTEVKKLVD